MDPGEGRDGYKQEGGAISPPHTGESKDSSFVDYRIIDLPSK
jgi:hypothetical protein